MTKGLSDVKRQRAERKIVPAPSVRTMMQPQHTEM